MLLSAFLPLGHAQPAFLYQAYLARVAGPFSIINNQENSHQMPQGYLMEAIPQLKFPILSSRLCQIQLISIDIDVPYT